eukprot:SAG22_NODE_110_length_19679_cov_45.046527_23_plen_34_part_00
MRLKGEDGVTVCRVNGINNIVTRVYWDVSSSRE